MSSPPLSLCLTCVGQKRAIITVDAHSSLFQLHQVARDTFQANDVVLKHGFPPSLVSNNPDKSCADAGIQDKDRIVVTIVATDTTSQDANEAPPNKKRTQRAAAKAATDSFGDVIRAQEDFLRREENKTKKTSTGSTRSSPKKRRAPKQPNLAQLPGGRRLQDGAAVTTNTTKRQKQSNGPKLKNEEDVSMALLNALNGGGGSSGKVGQVLRGAMRNAIANRYEASRAVSKVTAVQSNQYTIQEKNKRLSIEYSKGLEGRGMFEETVDCIPREALEAVISAIHQSNAEREMLQPVTLAQTSPRVFWSLVWLYQENADINTVQQCLSTLLPDLDWSFQNKRKRALSSKAKENLRQEQTKDTAVEENEEAAQEAVQAVESVMEQLGEYDASQRRERAARAALSRHGGGPVEENGTTMTRETATEEWQLVTPTERDDDELQECIDTMTTDEKATILTALHSLDIYNWRQLANANAETISQATNIPRNQVEQWIDYSQAQSVEEIIVEICNGNVKAVQVLRDEARTGTVKDLSNWRNMADMLYSSAPSLAGLGVQVEDVRTWCQRAQAVSEEFEWVQWYATPVE